MLLQDIWKFISTMNISLVLLVVYLITVFSTAIMVIREKRDPVKTSSWVLILILLPIAGLIFYIVFGQYHRKEKIFSRKGLSDLEQIEKLSELQIVKLHKKQFNQSQNISDNLSIITLLLNNSKSLLTEYNEIEIFRHTGKLVGIEKHLVMGMDAAFDIIIFGVALDADKLARVP